MKVKTRFGILVASMALCGAALVGCGSDPAPTPPTPSTYHVVCTSDAAKYTVNGLADSYAAGATVAFTVTENDPTNYKVTGVTSTQVTVTTVSALSYTFTMPETDVSLTVGTKEVDKYSVTTSTSDIVVNEEVTFLLKLGETEVVNVVISAGEGETKEMVIDDNTVTFKEEGDYVLKFRDGDRSVDVPGEFTFHARTRVHGETEDDPLTAEEAIAIGHELDITWNEKVDGQTVWHYGGVSEIFYYIEDVVTSVDSPAADIEQYKNISFHLGDFQAYRIKWKVTTGDDWEILKTIDVGSKVMVHGKIMNFGGKTTAKDKGTVETYSVAPDYANVWNVTNEIQSISLNKTSLALTVGGEDETLVASKHPNTADVVSWKSGNGAVATVSDAGVVHAVSEGETDITAYIEGTDIEATCHVEVSDTEKVFRIIGPSEINEEKSYFLAAGDATSLVYAKGEMSGYYIAVSDSEGTASAVQVIKSESKFKLKVGDKYLGYAWDGSHHNPTLEDDSSSAAVVALDYDAETFRFTFNGSDSSSTKLYLNFYQNTLRYSAATYSNPQFSIWGYAAPLAVESVALSKDKLDMYVGDDAELTYKVTPANATYETVTFASSDASVTVNATTGAVHAESVGSANITVTVDGVESEPCVVTVKEAIVGTTDVLTRATTGITGTSYADWSDKTSNSDAVYAGNSAGGNESIQLRSNNNNSGIVSTASGGLVARVVVVWNSNTASGRTLNVYGSNTAYTAPSQLYAEGTQGTLLGTIVCGTSTELVISGSYAFIGLRSAGSAMYLTSISITWIPAA